MTKLIKAVLLAKESLGEDYYSLTIHAPILAQTATPGQFVQFKCGDTLDPLLRRPLSIHRYNRKHNIVQFLFRQVGKGTRWLGMQKPGVTLDLLGPLGKGFTLEREEPALLVGGGIGVAPLLALGEALNEQGQRPITLIGANSNDHLLKISEFQEISQRVQVATQDGSAGKEGLVTELLQRELENGFTGFIYTCGPEPMMEAVAQLAGQYRLKGEASLEAPMACGIGVCLGCICKVQGKEGETYAHVCSDGPVFPLEVIIGYDKS